jgi:hypothetical protein
MPAGFRSTAPTWPGDPNSQTRSSSAQRTPAPSTGGDLPSGTDMKRVAEQRHRHEARGRCSYGRVLPKSAPPPCPPASGLERIPNSACNRGGRYSAKWRTGHDVIPHPGHWGPAPVAHQARTAQWPRPRARAGLPFCRISIARSEDPHFAGLSTWWPSIAPGVWRQIDWLPAAECPALSAQSEIFLFRGNEIFQPFALATPLYPVNLRLSGGELLRLCSVVRWPTRSADVLTSSSCLLIPILCTNGLVHGVARSALPLRRLHSGALYAP